MLLIRPHNAAVLPSPMLLRSYRLGWSFLCLVLYFFLRDLIPSKALVDATYIQNIAETAMDGEPTQGFATMSLLFSSIPFSFELVGFLNATLVYIIASSVRTFRGMVLLAIVLLPLILEDLPAPNKETLVLLAATLLWYASTRIRKEHVMTGIICAWYLVYGLFVRDYYLLILGAFVGILLLLRTPMMLRAIYPLLAIIGLIIVPSEILIRLGSVRDIENEIFFYGGSDVVRTCFLNPFPSDDGFHFVINYINAFIYLNVPFVHGFSEKEFILFAIILLCARLLYLGMTRFKGVQRLLPLLFLSHLVVLYIFEPDSGSYMRHFLSVLPYLLPALQWTEEQRIDQLTSAEAASSSNSPTFKAASKDLSS
ncbi:MAG: hypothetical protein PHD48_07495 [Alphaproteobacteria bacterium]|nr:hypothetical protein [Alphaproteobacteria bacterium]